MVSFNRIVTKRDSPDQWFQILLETLPHSAFLIGADGEAVAYNQRFIDYLGFQPGSDPASRNALHHPDERQRLSEARAAGIAAWQEYVIEARLRRHDGVYRWHRIHNTPILRQGIPFGWIGTAVDIHDIRETNATLEARVRERTAALEGANARLQAEIEQRRRTEQEVRASEHRFRTMFNRTPMALQSVGPDARLLEVNDTWTEMFGYTRGEALGRSPTDFMTPESVELYRNKSWPEMLASGGAVRSVDYRFVARDGRIFDGRLSARGEFGPEGRFIRSWSAIADVTAEKRADRDLRQVQRLDAVGQVTAGIAHDFNNLLTAILGNLELLSLHGMADPERAARLIANARAAAQRGARQTADLLSFSRPKRLIAAPADVNIMITGMLDLLQGSVGGDTEVTFVPGRNLWPAMVDTAQIELAVLNLAINARDAMRSGGSITLRTENVQRGESALPEEPGAGDYVAISISDTGSGIADDVRERIFEPFFTTKPTGRGSGLGLPQVLGVVKQLNGGIAVRSTAGTGTTFTLFLPRTSRTAEETTVMAGHMAASAWPSEAAERIVLVDDDPDVRVIAADMLRDAGYEVTEADSGSAALDVLAAKGTPAAMVVDVAMPVMTGVELADIVKRDYPALPVVFMTGYAATSLLPALSRYDVLRKPFQASDLALSVARALGKTAERGRRY